MARFAQLCPLMDQLHWPKSVLLYLIYPPALLYLSPPLQIGSFRMTPKEIIPINRLGQKKTSLIPIVHSGSMPG